MNISDGVVTGDLMREAMVVVGQMDAEHAIAWLRQTEDTVGVNIQRAADNVIDRLTDNHGLVLNDVQKGVLLRVVITTAVAAVTAVRAGHYAVWRDLVRGSSLSMFDPLLPIRRRVCPAKSPGTPGAKPPRKRSGRVSPAVDGTIGATKFGFVACTPATDADNPKAKFLLLTAVNPNGTCRHEAVYVQDGESLLRHLVDGLARLGSPAAKAAWSSVCGSDHTFDQMPDEATPPDGPDDAGHDADGPEEEGNSHEQ